MKKILVTLLVLAVITVGLYYFFDRKPVLKEQAGINYKNYPLVLDSIKIIKKGLARENDVRKLKRAFVDNITKRVFRYWYGTKWDFNGTTERPNEGHIACGYFVTTTLRDMGVPINRVKMAQCASEEMIRSLVAKKNIHHFSNTPLGDFERKMKKLGDGLYIIGLDNHTGFILISCSGNYFIHSSGWFPHRVVKDVMGTSGILQRSKYKVVGKISDDEGLLRKWVKS